ncbi:MULTISPECIES: PAS domain-containing protein [Antrihabitans]|jgi:PAS domain S-box-containing protein|uniref:PAS domain-containing protein n=2 Tax=Antrihabitans TaxID=2799491 RepID=A0A934U2J4_9NOCA|nr:PAS domain-containing protein [Antrihabitans stalagmiti]MBJ8339239.1 PAS domain-containing protein [Antrihabitans stalagmiti]
MYEERKPAPDTALGYLHQLPALILIDRLPIPILAVDAKGEVLHANPALEELLGYDPGNLTGRPLDNLLGRSPDEYQSAIGVLACHGGQPIALRHRNGDPVRVIASDSVFMRRDDPITLVSLHDVTENLWAGGPYMSLGRAHGA